VAATGDEAGSRALVQQDGGERRCGRYKKNDRERESAMCLGGDYSPSLVASGLFEVWRISPGRDLDGRRCVSSRLKSDVAQFHMGERNDLKFVVGTSLPLDVLFRRKDIERPWAP